MILSLQATGAELPAAPGGLVALFLVGRILFAAIFIVSGLNHFMKLGPTAQYAAAFKVPAAKLAVVVTGVMILTGGLSILLGVAVRVGAVLLVLFLIPTSLWMHRFWGLQDAMMAQNQMAHFLKNMVMAGAALLVYYFSTLHPEAWVYALGR